VNVKEYIESGLLESYLLGALSTEEETQVAADIAQYPELKAELDSIEAGMLLFAESMAETPPAGLQDKIWNSLPKGSTGEKEINNDGQPKSRVIAMEVPDRFYYAQWQRAAIWIVLVGSLLVNILLWYQRNETSEQYAATKQQIDSLQHQQSQLATVLNSYESEKKMMSDTGMQTIVMHTVQKGHPMAATLFWSKDKGEAYVSINGLPAPPKGMQYQLWVIQDGKPVDMGVLPNNMANTPAMQKVSKPVTGGEAFAISLEKEGGSPTPTMQNIYVMGKPS